ncbi:chitinase-3-like protein 1 [Mya arenaria]|uniref:chitinase-3-like protein 1 n=1 Tax=Mya arenaria TaxID=6604 RepID=UPI0022E88BE7|nr:chitinase-3-like protein 1 [Mya arenaria]
MRDLFCHVSSHHHGRLLLCYVTSWSQHRPPPYNFRLEDSPPEMCTHLVYAFAGVDADTSELVTVDHSDIDNFQQLKSIKDQNPHLKTILAVGGWEHGSRPFSMMTSSFETRQVFINQSVAFLTKHGLDGLEIFWEYPTNYERGGLWEDKQNFADLLTEMGPVYRKAGLILSAAVPSARWIIDAGYNPEVMQRELDFVSVMTYDLHGSWETTVGHHSPLRSSDKLNMKSVAEYWVSKGMSKEKLVIGLPLYGRTFQLASPYLTAPGSGAVGPGSPGKYTDEPGFLAYNEVCELLSSEQADFRRHWLQQADVPYMEDGQDWVGYDDPDSITAKVAWLIGEGYAGAMVWTLDMDDFRGACPLSRAPYPMINRIHRLLKGENGTVGQTCKEDGVMGYPCDDVSATCSAETNVCVCSSPTVSDGLQCLKQSGLEEACDTKFPTPCLGEQTRCSLEGNCVCVTGFKPLQGQCFPQPLSTDALPPDVGSSTDALPHDRGPSTDALLSKVWSSTDATPADVGLSTDAPPTNVGFKDLQISVDTGATTASEEREEWDRPPGTDANGDVGARIPY